MTWTIMDLLKATKGDEATKLAKENLLKEMGRLNKQRCSECSGYGHAPKDCPTAFKIKHLEVGVREQAKLIKLLRAETKKVVKSCPVSELSLLKVRPMLGKRARPNND